MNTVVSNFLTRHNFVCHEDINTVAASILADMQKGLCGEKSDEDMIKTFMVPPKARIVNKSVIVIDAGGTNFRSSLLTFDGAGEVTISDMEKTKMPGVERELGKAEFFAAFADNLEHLKNKADCIGFCFSYPMKITEDGDGVLLGFSKEVKAPEVVGCKIGECLVAELEKRGWNKINRITLLNDTAAALLAGHAIAKQGKDYSSYIGLILGTGLNCAYVQSESSVYNMAQQIVVCESGKSMCVSRSDFDRDLDDTTTHPGTFAMEKTCSGAYLGPIAWRLLQGAAKEGLFSEGVSKRILDLTGLTLIELDQYLHTPKAVDSTLAKALGSDCTESDRENMFEILDAIVERSARRATAILTACVIQSEEGKKANRPVCILCDGTTFHKTYKIRARVEGYLEEVLTRQRNLFWEITSCDNDITLGTGIAGCIQ